MEKSFVQNVGKAARYLAGTGVEGKAADSRLLCQKLEESHRAKGICAMAAERPERAFSWKTREMSKKKRPDSFQRPA
jgi:hypothetical protein